METTVQFRGYDRTKYDLTDPYAQRYMARDRAMEAANVALVASALGWNCTLPLARYALFRGSICTPIAYAVRVNMHRPPPPPQYAHNMRAHILPPGPLPQYAREYAYMR